MVIIPASMPQEDFFFRVALVEEGTPVFKDGLVFYVLFTLIGCTIFFDLSLLPAKIIDDSPLCRKKKKI